MQNTAYTSENKDNELVTTESDANVDPRTPSLPPIDPSASADQRNYNGSFRARYGETELPAPPLSVLFKKSQYYDPMTNSIQIWEGKILDVDNVELSMNVILKDINGSAPDHSMDISMEWVSEQDYDLVKLGAVFYLTLYKETKRGSIRNSQELRFRRLPSWSKSQLDSFNEKATQLLKRFSVKSLLDNAE